MYLNKLLHWLSANGTRRWASDREARDAAVNVPAGDGNRRPRAIEADHAGRLQFLGGMISASGVGDGRRWRWRVHDEVPENDGGGGTRGGFESLERDAPRSNEHAHHGAVWRVVWFLRQAVGRIPIGVLDKRASS